MNSAMGGLIRRMVLATSALLLIVGGAFGVLLISINEQREAARMSRHSEEVLRTADQVQRLSADTLSAQLQFTITRDPAFLGRWQATQAALPGMTTQLEQLASTPQQRDQAERIARTTESLVHDYSAPAVEAAQRGDPSAVSEPTLQEGNRRIGEVRAELDVLRASELDVIAAHSRQADMTADREMVAVVVGMVGSVLVIALVGGYQTRLMIQPIRRAAVMADRLAGGDLSARMPATGKAEIGQLERSFNIMAASLERSHRELAQFVETQTALRRVATLVARGVSPDEVLGGVAEEIAWLTGAETARVVRYEPDGDSTIVAAWGRPDLELPVGTRVPLEGRNIAAMVLRTGRAARIDDYGDAPGPLAAHLRKQGVHAAVGAPIHVEGRLWGVMIATTMSTVPPPPDAEARLADYTDLVGTAIANTQTRADLVASRARFVLATDQARRQIERDIHDGVQQRLISLGLDVRRAEADVPPELSGLRSQLSAVMGGLIGTVNDLRELSRGLHPAILTVGGLRPALAALARRSPVEVHLDVRLASRLPEPVEVAGYYVAAEALTNAAKHARATLIQVEASVVDECLLVSVIDNGVGGADPERGSGLIGITDRLEALGGKMTVDSPPGQGTRLCAQLPLDHL